MIDLGLFVLLIHHVLLLLFADLDGNQSQFGCHHEVTDGDHQNSRENILLVQIALDIFLLCGINGLDIQNGLYGEIFEFAAEFLGLIVIGEAALVIEVVQKILGSLQDVFKLKTWENGFYSG